MLLKRIITALIGIPLLVFVSYKSGIFLLCAVLLLIVLGLAEFNNIITESGYRNMVMPMWLGGVIIPYAVQYNSNAVILTVFIYVAATVIYYLIKHPYFSPLDLSLSFMGFIYVVLGFTHLILLRNLSEGFWLIIYVFVIVWSTDTAAFFVGTYFGKHRLAPAISPKKTWEGLFGGLVFSIFTAYILVTAASLNYGKVLVLMAPLISLSGQFGDLFESTLKRFAGIKDSGYIIPGHGGVLDRFDSTIWAAPFTYHLLVCLERLY